jgi:isopenicillin-N N-acyltransferase-like protein
MNVAEHSFPLIDVSGSAYEMGYQHGVQAADLIEKYLLWIERLSGRSRDDLRRMALSLVPYIEGLNPLLVEEIRGLGEGAGISFEDAVLCQARTGGAGRVEGGGCTAFALTGDATADGQPLAGQNHDPEPEFAEMAILLHVKPSDGRPRALHYTFAGQIGYLGMNEHGVAHFANALYGYRWKPVLPLYPLMRSMLETSDVDGCIDLLRSHSPSAAQNSVLCDGRGNIANVEVRPDGIAVFEDDRPNWRVHTNHYLAREFARHEDGTLPDSWPRRERMRGLIGERWGYITVETMKGFLSDHQGDPAAICRHGDGGMHTSSGYIAEPAKGLLHVRRGHGCLGSWRTYEV